MADMADYQLTPALTVGLVGNIAQFNYKGNHVRSGEINAFSRWVPTDPVFKNLTVWAMVGLDGHTKARAKHRCLPTGTIRGRTLWPLKLSLSIALICSEFCKNSARSESRFSPRQFK